jgi:replicative DNA helicase
MVDTYGEDGILICLEMTKLQLARKWVAHKAGIADNIPKTKEEEETLKGEFLAAIPAIRTLAGTRAGDLYFCLPKYKKADDIYKLIIECIRRYGVKWIALDNIQRLCDTTVGSKNRTQHLSEISKVLSQIAKEYNIQMIRVLQPHRIADGKMVTTDDVDGASQIAKDCDCMITLHRNRINQISSNDFETMGHVESELAFDEKMLVTVGLSRYSSGGYTTLHYDGARSTVTDYDPSAIAAIKAVMNKNVGHENQLKQMMTEGEVSY